MFSFIKKCFKDLHNIPLYCKSLNFKGFLLFLKRPFYIRKCIVHMGAKFTSDNGKLIMTLQKYNTAFSITSFCNINALEEIFYSRTYKINNAGRECIVIDIGMNIGGASVFFAMMDNVKKVYGFEPFKETYEQAVYNLSINKEAGEKVVHYNFGLSDKDETKSVLFSINQSGSMSTVGDEDYLQYVDVDKKQMSTERISLKPAAEVLSGIIEKENGKKIIIKMDCEGSEYEILDSLDAKGLLDKIDYILLEWHYRGEERILDILRKYNFVSFSKYHCGFLGLINAAKARE